MRRDLLSSDRELLQVALLIFSAVSLATLEFIKNSFYRTDGVLAPKDAVVYTIILVQVVPTILLVLADRVIAARDKSGKALRRFRTVVFAVAILLILRQVQIYWGPAKDLSETLRSVTVVLLLLLGLVVLVAVVLLCVRFFRGVVLFFMYMSPVAIAMTAIVPFQVPTRGALPEGYAQEVVREAQSGSNPPVFIVIFDELPYDVLVKDGQLDAESLPNFAALAEDGTWFTNATSNYYWSVHSIPTIIDPVVSLADRFDVRLYIQFPPLEDSYVQECGQVYTCRGERYLAENNRLWLATNLALRSLYEATPRWMETAIKWPVGWLVNPLGSTYPQADPFGYQALTKKEFDLFLNDIDGQEAQDTIYVLHSLATHWPYSYDENEKAISSDSSAIIWVNWEHSRKSARFADSLLGRLIDKLKEEGIYEESVIVVTSDHGLRTFSPSPEKPPEQFEVQVPLLIRAPGMDGEISDVDYQHIDFGATLMDLLGLPPPEDSQGVSAFSEERPERDKVFHVNRQTYINNGEDGSWRPVEEQ